MKKERPFKEKPEWVHFGIGNIFLIFLGGIADDLVSRGIMDTGIICAKTFDTDIIDKIYTPHDNLCLGVILHKDGSMDKRVIGSLAECVKARREDTAGCNILIFWLKLSEALLMIHLKC
jgi:hypothetical protein